MDIEKSYNAAPFISLQYNLYKNVMLTGWTNIFNYGVSEMKGSSEVKTIETFGSKISLTYFFK
ncbi:hypothetical protein DID80_04080 [Candidatus Marinamargulisbacteria bacterium SCGC AAA071-K20]|nr:hypothetical protein DID80_04080 [Candidatus Marinamargulisbacteria bacterium SCGC AAA071-K20]